MRPVLLWTPAIVLAAAIFALSSLPGSAFPSVAIFSFDKLAHALVFGVLSALVTLPLDRLKLIERRGLLIGVAALITTAYGVSDELHQRFTPGRSSGVDDVVADAVGAVIGSWAWIAFARRKKERRPAAS